ncbi:MAG TPA: alternative ribosome rescue aminoacyl-tRNA hydrolase ArfB [Stellaceae bacterium]|nr:alternative ribosome rescue aminoacyl-tRNA hydrolase ArfB [Stellaceae bacterium]
MIAITDELSLDEREISESFIRAAGPGGMNVNSVASAAQLRFDVRNSPSLPEPVRTRLERLVRARISHDGVLVITARRYRSQDLNRQDARHRLVALIRRAASPPPPRKRTRPSPAQREARRADKARRAALKQQRRPPPSDETP